MENFDDTAMFMYGQMLSAISSDILDTHEIFMMALTFLSMLSILDEAGSKKIFGKHQRTIIFKLFGDAAFAVDPNIQCMLNDLHSMAELSTRSCHGSEFISKSYSDFSRRAFEACRMNSPPRSLPPRSPPRASLSYQPCWGRAAPRDRTMCAAACALR